MVEVLRKVTGQSLPGALYVLVGLFISVAVFGLLNTALPLKIYCASILVYLAWRYPEVILALFLTVGAFKRNPTIASMFQGDPMIILALLLLLAVGRSMIVRSIRFPSAVLLLLPVLLLTITGAWGPANDYGTQKALRFGTLTVLAMLGCLSLLNHRRQFTLFLLSMAIVATVVTVLAALGQQTDSTARLRMDGTSPITLARMSIIALTFSWLSIRLLPAFRRPWLLIPLALLSLYVAVATGSRGPLLSFAVGLALLEIISRRYHNSPFLPKRWLIGLLASVILLVVSGVIPADPLNRFTHVVSGGYDRSLSQRAALYDTSLHLLSRSPFGIGIGGFSEHAILQLRYPHNIFLEVGVELGWVPLLCLLILSVWSAWMLFLILKAERSWTTCLLAMIVVMSGINAMVTGDLNDNRMFFALVLVPFLYRPTQLASPGLERSRVHRRGLHLATPS